MSFAKEARGLYAPAAMQRLLLLAALSFAACHKKETDDGQSAKQRAQADQTDKAAKKGALTEKLDPKKDLEEQEHNLKRLKLDYEGSKKAGNHAAVWAIEWDMRTAKKLVKKDEQLIAQGETKKDVSDPAAAKAESKGRAQ
jgi:hypothetical protein